MNDGSNRWVTHPPAAPAVSGVQPVTEPTTPLAGPAAPQSGVPAPDTADRLPRRVQLGPATIWWLGAHGGAGETTLAGLAPRTRAAEHAWPMPAERGTYNRVVVVARANYSGLMAAQRAAIEWASGTLGDGVQVVGLVLIPDAPGKRPKEIRQLELVVGGGFPRVWSLPWVEAWRTGPLTRVSLPLFHQLFADLSLST